MGWPVWGLNPTTGTRFFSSPKCPNWLLRPTQPPVQWVLWFFPGVKQLWHQVTYSPPSSAEVKHEQSYTSAPVRRLHGVRSEKLHSHHVPFLSNCSFYSVVPQDVYCSECSNFSKPSPLFRCLDFMSRQSVLYELCPICFNKLWFCIYSEPCYSQLTSSFQT
jgi:hypothetical protein